MSKSKTTKIHGHPPGIRRKKDSIPCNGLSGISSYESPNGSEVSLTYAKNITKLEVKPHKEEKMLINLNIVCKERTVTFLGKCMRLDCIFEKSTFLEEQERKGDGEEKKKFSKDE